MINKTRFIAALFALALVGCQNSPSTSDTDEAVEAISGEGPKFHTDFQAASAEASQSGKPIVAVFSATWCGPCQSMKNKVYPSAEVAPYSDKFVWAYLDADNPANRALMESHGVNGIPHISFVGADGTKLGETVGYSEPKKFASILAGVLER